MNALVALDVANADDAPAVGSLYHGVCGLVVEQFAVQSVAHHGNVAMRMEVVLYALARELADGKYPTTDAYCPPDVPSECRPVDSGAE